MFSKIESGTGSSGDAGNTSSAQLLRDIEEISKALYLHKTPPNALISSAQIRSQSVGKIRPVESKSNSNIGFFREDPLYKDKKSSSIWNWKKTLKALTHIGNRKFDCCFYLHVHSIEGLPANFDGFTLCVHWKRKGEVLRQTRQSRVFEGMAEFDETLMHRCSVYGSTGGPNHLAKYDAKVFLVNVSVIGAPELDIGKHWVDLTRLLPLTLEELEGEKSSGEWMTSFKLTGKAEGASLNVSFGFSVIADYLVKPSGNVDVPKLLNLAQNKSSTEKYGAGFHPGNFNRMLQRSGSLRSNLNSGSVLSSQSVDVKICHEVLLNPGLELSKSINFLYQKLGEEKMHGSGRSNCEQVEPLKLKPDLGFESAEESNGYESDEAEFTIIERGVEVSNQEQLQSDQATVQTIDGFAIRTINVDEIIKDDDISIDNKANCNSKDGVYGEYLDEVMVDDRKDGENSLCTKESIMEDAELASHHLRISESAELDPSRATGEFLEDENNMEVKSNYHPRESVKESCSLDDVTELVARDFLNMLGIEHSSARWSSYSDPESPRERLLRQFEKEALASGNFNIFDAMEEQSEFDCTDPPGSDCGNCPEDFDLSSFIQVSEEEQNRESQLLSRRKATILEDLETEALMREWGINEKFFKSSPCNNRSSGFGSPIELAPEEPLELPPLGEGLGPFAWISGGGFLRSLNPSLFRNSKNGGSLIMQVSSPIVLPAEMGYDIIEISQNLALVGTEKMFVQVNKLMPLVDISGKMMEELARKAASSTVVPERQALFQHESVFGMDACGGMKVVEGCPSNWSCNKQSSGFIGGEMGLDSVSLKDLAPLAMDKIETLSIEGLRIQSGMTDEDAPSSINSQSTGKVLSFSGKTSKFGGSRLEKSSGLQQLDIKNSGSDVDGLMDLSLTLDDWLRLDAGIIGDEDQNSEHTSEILAAHHAKCTDFVNGRLARDVNWDNPYGSKYGLLGSNLTLALMVQLREPLRNYEPVGVPMIALIQVERVFVPPTHMVDSMIVERSSNEEGDIKEITKNEDEEEGSIPQFKITEVHLAGVNSGPDKRQLWGTITQQQSGSRWLLANGMGKTNKHPFSKSKAIVISSPRVTKATRPGDILWSISSPVNRGTDCAELAAWNPHLRSPNVIFPDMKLSDHT